MTGDAGGGDPGPRGASELALRTLSAALLVPAALALIYFGGIAFALMSALLATVLLREWSVIVGAGGDLVAAAVAHVGVLAVLLLTYLGDAQTAFGILFVVALGLYLSGLARSHAPNRWLACGTLYAGATGIVLILLRQGSEGALLILFLFLVVWVTDIVAYFVGRKVGGPKLWRRVSPKKTWSGALGGLGGALVVGAVTSGFSALAPAFAWILAAGVLSIYAQIGDLAESALKRRFGVKDSGTIIPGHGGVMDRIDGVVGAAVLGYLTALAIGGQLADPAAAFLNTQGL